MTALWVEGCTVNFGGLYAVDNVSLEFPSDGITGLIGPNGSGKSTFVNMVSGQIPNATGRVYLGEQMISGLRADQIVRSGLARTYQVPRVPKELTLGEVLSVPLAYIPSSRPFPAEITNVDDIRSFCGLSPPANTLCGSLSVSDLRRLEIARALACRPRVLILDESMAGLGVDDIKQMIELLKYIHNAGVTIIIIEHIMRIIAELCDHAVVFNDGHVLAEGPPQNVLIDPSVREAYLGKGFSM